VKATLKLRTPLVLTDGKPNDVDHYEGRFADKDAAKAVREARRSGVAVFGVTVDANAQSYFPTLFGAAATSSSATSAACRRRCHRSIGNWHVEAQPASAAFQGARPRQPWSRRRDRDCRSGRPRKAKGQNCTLRRIAQKPCTGYRLRKWNFQLRIKFRLIRLVSGELGAINDHFASHGVRSHVGVDAFSYHSGSIAMERS
jgi:hypothetical protein